MSPPFIGLDLGTTAVKACAFTATGSVLDQETRTYSLYHPVPGAAVQQIEEIVTATEEALTALCLRLATRPRALGLSAAMHSLLLCDAQMQPLTALITWADVRAEAVMPTFPAAQRTALHRQAGVPVHPMTPLVKLKWLLQTQPELRKTAVYCTDLKSFLLHRWTGRYLIDEQLAAATGWYKLTSRSWSAEALRATMPGTFPFRLPEIVAIDTLLDWQPAVAHRLGMTGVALYPGGSDGVLSNLGSGLLQADELVVSVGTSGAVRVTHQQRDVAPARGLFNYPLYGNYYVLGGATNNGGNVLAYWQQLLCGHFPDMDSFMRAALSPAAERLPVFQPWLYGERAPVWQAAATAAITGLRSDHTPVQLAQAVVHGVTDNLVAIIRQVEVVSGPARQISVTGGITRSPQWLALLAQKSQRPIVQQATPQAAAWGAAMVAKGDHRKLLG